MIESIHELLSARVIKVLARSIPFDKPESAERIAGLFGPQYVYALRRVGGLTWDQFYTLISSAGLQPSDMQNVARLRSLERLARTGQHYDRLPPQLFPPSRISEASIVSVLEQAGLGYVLSTFPANLNQ